MEPSWARSWIIFNGSIIIPVMKNPDVIFAARSGRPKSYLILIPSVEEDARWAERYS
jgi:hypothetical protein